ncbi:hypothetical protein PSSM2_046 [Prochlorococcus phage P-SSM2]|uniref:Uncharacterized protein n=1 Tax=Prochlorococcus phage P-SSM2 TaxID=268746 RepID=Q58MV8_BPPRM|nr:hypothetical protein PSSM2_046 [Prochlorococcus phage P-SSM2]AAX44424.1 hypothetical protein PSSM2_046 [Prochlorococcus phage P-SSM2]ACY75922.1 conserved hypothetical protein [Prochlorococcus phage P-SSM2]
MTEQERWDCGRTLLLESLYKPDDKLRGCAFNQGCKDELLEIRDQVIEMVRDMKNPHSPKLEFGKKNDHVEPTISTPNGDISETLMSGTLGDYYMSEKREY